jgi:hypothetical protein
MFDFSGILAKMRSGLALDCSDSFAPPFPQSSPLLLCGMEMVASMLSARWVLAACLIEDGMDFVGASQGS